MTTTIAGQIDEGWLGTDRSTDERKEGGANYVLDVVIGATCRLQFKLLARSPEEAKGLVQSLLQLRVDWDKDAPTELEMFWYDTVPMSFRSLSAQSREWLARHGEKYGAEKVKGAILTAAKRSEFATFENGDGLARYMGGILRRPEKPTPVPEPIHLKGTTEDEK